MGFFDWFRRNNTAPPEQKAVSPTVSAYVYTPGQVTNGFYRKNGVSFEQAAQEGYGKNVIAYASVDEVAKAISSPPWLAYQRPLAVGGRASLDRKEVSKPPVFIRPNPYQSWADFLYAAASYHRIAGEVPIEAITPGGSYNEPPTQLYLHQPDTIRPIPGRVGLSAYGFINASGQLIPKWPVDPITGNSNMRLIKTFNPCDPWRGLSPIEAAALSIDLHNDANTWNANLLRRGASSDLLVTAKAAMSDKSLSRLKAQFEEDMSGARNVKAVTLIEGVGDQVTVDKIGFSARDMSWIEGLHVSAHEVAIALGGSTMPFLLGLSDGAMTYSNQETARLAFWDTFVLPLLLMVFRDELNAWLMPRYGDGLELDVNLDQVPALEPRRREMWERLEKSTFLSINQKLEALGYDKSPAEGADVPIALLPVMQAKMVAENMPEEDQQTEEQKGASFERDLIATGIAPELAKDMRRVTFLNGTLKNGTVH